MIRLLSQGCKRHPCSSFPLADRSLTRAIDKHERKTFRPRHKVRLVCERVSFIVCVTYIECRLGNIDLLLVLTVSQEHLKVAIFAKITQFFAPFGLHLNLTLNEKGWGLTLTPFSVWEVLGNFWTFLVIIIVSRFVWSLTDLVHFCHSILLFLLLAFFPTNVVTWTARPRTTSSRVSGVVRLRVISVTGTGAITLRPWVHHLRDRWSLVAGGIIVLHTEVFVATVRLAIGLDSLPSFRPRIPFLRVARVVISVRWWLACRIVTTLRLFSIIAWLFSIALGLPMSVVRRSTFTLVVFIWTIRLVVSLSAYLALSASLAFWVALRVVRGLGGWLAIRATTVLAAAIVIRARAAPIIFVAFAPSCLTIAQRLSAPALTIITLMVLHFSQLFHFNHISFSNY